MACGGELTKSEHALAFLLFDLAACIQHDTTPPVPPPVVVDQGIWPPRASACGT